VRAGAAVGLPGHIRISIGTAAQTERLLAALDVALGRAPLAPPAAGGAAPLDDS